MNEKHDYRIQLSHAVLLKRYNVVREQVKNLQETNVGLNTTVLAYEKLYGLLPGAEQAARKARERFARQQEADADAKARLAETRRQEELGQDEEVTVPNASAPPPPAKQQPYRSTIPHVVAQLEFDPDEYPG